MNLPLIFNNKLNIRTKSKNIFNIFKNTLQMVSNNLVINSLIIKVKNIKDNLYKKMKIKIVNNKKKKKIH